VPAAALMRSGHRTITALMSSARPPAPRTPPVPLRAGRAARLREDRQQAPSPTKRKMSRKNRQHRRSNRGERKTKRNPSSAACSDTSSREPPSDNWRAGTSRIISSDMMTNANEIRVHR